MKKLAVLLIAISSLLTGCVVYDGPYRGGNDHSRDRDGGPAAATATMTASGIATTAARTTLIAIDSQTRALSASYACPRTYLDNREPANYYSNSIA
jgi:protein involved in sex pheromone biosynthesis